ncbi:MAG: ORF6N domain-containing protein, partial [Coprococcus sp.]
TVDNICNRVYIIRGQQVMIDYDLAEIYGYEVKRLNEQVKRNITRFPEDFMFQLTKDEIPENFSKSQIATLNENGDRTYDTSVSPDGKYELTLQAVGEQFDERITLYFDGSVDR